MRVLFSTTAGAGQFGPMVPFAEACRDAGHPTVARINTPTIESDVQKRLTNRLSFLTGSGRRRRHEH